MARREGRAGTVSCMERSVGEGAGLGGLSPPRTPHIYHNTCSSVDGDLGADVNGGLQPAWKR